MDYRIDIVDVFPAGVGGGNPAPIVTEAQGLDADRMRKIARQYGHESGFVFPSDDDSDAKFRFRFFVPRHEMEMCGHASMGALWLLRRGGRVAVGETVAIDTLSGCVLGRVCADGTVQVSQPAGQVDRLESGAVRQSVADVLGIAVEDILPIPVANAKTSRVKTLVALRTAETLHRLQPDFGQVEAFCESISSTGLYPFAMNVGGNGLFHARQFPKSSGYPEDAATGIAASALAFGVRALGLVGDDVPRITVRQGEAMGRPSEIHVAFADESASSAVGCWLGGLVRYHEAS